jgi:hypothetical protein
MAAATAAAIIGGVAAVKSGVDASKNAKAATAAGQQQTAEARAFTEQQQAQARADLQHLFPQAQQRQQQGFQGALDAFKTTLPAQTQAFSQGNQQAQGTIAAGLPQIQRALLGLSNDFSGLQAQNIQPQGLDALAGLQLPSGQVDLTTPLTDDQVAGEAQANQLDSAVTSVFQELLGRDPDPSGLAWARGIAGSGGLAHPDGVNSLRSQILGGDEYKQRLAAVNAQQAPAGPSAQDFTSLGFNF